MMQHQVVSDDLDQGELQEKLTEYSNFVDSTLTPELARTVAAREEVEEEVREYTELYEKLQAVTASTSTQNDKDGADPSLQKAMVNLGHELVYCRAQVEDPTIIFVHVGKGFFVEFTTQQALTVIRKRLDFLEKHVLPKRINDASRVAGHVESSLAIVEALARLVVVRDEQEQRGESKDEQC